jgi:hypothetical protein
MAMEVSFFNSVDFLSIVKVFYLSIASDSILQ